MQHRLESTAPKATCCPPTSCTRSSSSHAPARSAWRGTESTMPHIGFVMGAAGTDTADVALMDDDLRNLPTFVWLSRARRRYSCRRSRSRSASRPCFWCLPSLGRRLCGWPCSPTWGQACWSDSRASSVRRSSFGSPLDQPRAPTTPEYRPNPAVRTMMVTTKAA